MRGTESGFKLCGGARCETGKPVPVTTTAFKKGHLELSSQNDNKLMLFGDAFLGLAWTNLHLFILGVHCSVFVSQKKNRSSSKYGGTSK